MHEKILTTEDLDKLREIEGFPLGADEDIISLSDPPFYTACPNPFISDFIEEHGKIYDENADDYHREPYAADVSEGKSDPVYNAHSYHTKVPPKAVMRYILHYTNPGDIVFDGFCGSGMTGVAAQMCADKNLVESLGENFSAGSRKTVLTDLSPAATFIAYNYNHKTSANDFETAAKKILDECDKEFADFYKTNHVSANPALIDDENIFGRINYVVWSDVLICPHCGSEFVFYDVAFDEENKKVRDIFTCTNCAANLKKKDCVRAQEQKISEIDDSIIFQAKQVPVLINYTYQNKKFTKTPDADDLALIEKIEQMKIPYWYPTNELPPGYNTAQPIRSHNFSQVNDFYTKRNLFVLARMKDLIGDSSAKIIFQSINPTLTSKLVRYNLGNRGNGSLNGTLYISSLTAETNVLNAFSGKMRDFYKLNQLKDNLNFWFTSQLINISKMNRYRPAVSFPYNPLSGTLYISSLISEANPFTAYNGKIRKISVALDMIKEENSIISCQSSTELKNIPDKSIDYIFTDPPFGANLNYSELSFIWESWLKVFTNNKCEAIMNDVQEKGLTEYQELMTRSFKEFNRILKPNRWITVEFHNSKNAVWSAIQEALMRAGFVVADVRTLDKQQGSFKQVTSFGAVKQDLVISAYKPKENLIINLPGKVSEETAWKFVRQHLENLPVTVKIGDKLDLISERRAFLLFDRMVAYHIVNGLSVPMDAGDFYRGLEERFPKRDDMFFLPNQVNEYDISRSEMELTKPEISLFMTDEKSAISWIYSQLDEKSNGFPQTYQTLQPKFIQALKSVKKNEKLPELMTMLEENFLKDDAERWYIPNLSKSGDITKLREKNLLREFRDYLTTHGKLKNFRSEAVKVGFNKLWADGDYKKIVEFAERLPEETILEDEALLMYYDLSKGQI